MPLRRIEQGSGQHLHTPQSLISLPRFMYYSRPARRSFWSNNAPRRRHCHRECSKHPSIWTRDSTAVRAASPGCFGPGILASAPALNLLRYTFRIRVVTTGIGSGQRRQNVTIEPSAIIVRWSQKSSDVETTFRPIVTRCCASKFSMRFAIMRATAGFWSS
jgi:hypothetical protein